MYNHETMQDTFNLSLYRAVQALSKGDTPSARVQIANAMILNMDAAQPHNLLGILYELDGDDAAARRQYRAAYALDPTYKPACRNLERLVMFSWAPQSRRFDYGEYFQMISSADAST